MNYIEIAKGIASKGWFAGVRSLCEDELYEVGDDCRESYEWDVENDCSTYYTTGETAGGTCAMYIESPAYSTDDEDEIAEFAACIEAAVAKHAGIYGGQQVIIAGRSVNTDGYFDDGECRIVEAVVFGIVK